MRPKLRDFDRFLTVACAFYLEGLPFPMTKPNPLLAAHCNCFFFPIDVSVVCMFEVV